jgi:hypothetical protein
VSAPLAGNGPANRGDLGAAAALYRKLDAAALLVSTAERCSLDACAGCATPPGYVCGGCSRASDAAHSVDNLLFALFAALEATRTHNGARPYLHFELAHKIAAPSPLPAPSQVGCSGQAAMSDGPPAAAVAATTDVVAAAETGSYPARFYAALRKRLGPKCVCYHQRERRCPLEETQTVLGRLVNQESPGPFDPCTQEATRRSGRHVHFEWHNLPIETVASALAEAVPR